MRFTLLFLTGLILGVSAARADFARDLSRIHTEAVGGRANINALKTLKATGVTRNARGDLKFVLWAARPDRIRTEVASGGRTIVQAWDGAGEPWSTDSQSRRITVITGAGATEFKMDAEFDDPLIAGPARQIALDYAGPVEMDGRELLKVVVTHHFTSTSFVYLDPVSFLIVRREDLRRRKTGEVLIRTDYSDFRAVGGVILPHRLVISQNGKQLNETVVERIEPNPELAADLFKMPPVVGDKER